MVDVNGAYSVHKSIEIGKQLEALNVFHFEEPRPHYDLQGLSEVADAFQPGDHGSTFAGQPLAASAARETLRVLEEIQAPKLAKEKGAEMVAAISNIDGVDSVRGLGLLLGVEIEKQRLEQGDARELAHACLREGLVVNGVTRSALRLAPPLTISSEEITEGAEILEKVLKTRKEDAS